MFDNIKYFGSPDDFWTRTNQLIKKLGKTQVSLAVECGFGERRISNLSADNKFPRGDELVKIAKTLGTTAEYLVTGNAPNDADKSNANIAAIKAELRTDTKAELISEIKAEILEVLNKF